MLFFEKFVDKIPFSKETLYFITIVYIFQEFRKILEMKKKTDVVKLWNTRYN